MEKTTLKPFAPDKILYHIDRIADWKAGKNPMPMSVEIDMTNACDNFCPWCFGYSGLDRQDKKTWVKGNVGQYWTFDEIAPVLTEMSDAGVKSVIFTGGGEPLVNPWIEPSIQHAYACGLDVALITNGNRLDRMDLGSLLRACTWIRVSVDATNAEEYLQEHGSKEWAKLIRNIEALVAAKREGKHECTVGIGFLTNGQNDNHILAFARLGVNLGVDYAQYRPLLLGHGTKDARYDSQFTVARIQEAIEMYQTDAYTVTFSEAKYGKIMRGDIGRHYKTCHYTGFTAAISADKHIYVCCHMRGMPEFSMGSLADHTFTEIWEGSQRQDAYSNIDVTHPSCPPLCKGDSANEVIQSLMVPPTHENFV